MKVQTVLSLCILYIEAATSTVAALCEDAVLPQHLCACMAQTRVWHATCRDDKMYICLMGQILILIISIIAIAATAKTWQLKLVD